MSLAGMPSPDPQVTTLLFSWQGHWVAIAALAAQLLVSAWYLSAVMRVRRQGRPWPAVQVASFLVGMAVVAYATEGGIARYESDNFTTRVIQLLLLVDVAPALLTLSSPARLCLLAARGRPGAALWGALRSRMARALFQPLVVLALYIASTYCYFLTPWYGASAGHPVSVLIVDLYFVIVGWLLWWVIGARDALPRPARTGARFALVLLAVPFNAFLGLRIASMSHPLYARGNTLADTQAGGNIFWALAELFSVVALALLFVDWAREEERRAIRADRQFDAALAAARAVADGHDAQES